MNGELIQPFVEFQQFVNLCRNQSSITPIIWFGDSSLDAVSRNDHNKTNLFELTEQTLRAKGFLLKTVHRGGFQLRLFYYFIKCMQVLNYRPHAVILEINLRNFSPQWDLRPAFEFKDEIRSIKEFIADPSSQPRNVSRVTVNTETPEQIATYEAYPVNHPGYDFKTVGEFRAITQREPQNAHEEEIRRRTLFIFHFLTVLSYDHPKLEYFRQFLEVLCDMDIPTLCYITPTNYEAGITLVGPQFKERVEANIALVEKSFQKCRPRDSEWFNWAFLLDAQSFSHPFHAGEHLNWDGRRRLSAQIVKETMRLFAKQTVT